MPYRDQPESDPISNILGLTHLAYRPPLGPILTGQRTVTWQAAHPALQQIWTRMDWAGKQIDCPFLSQIKIVHDSNFSEQSKVFLCLSISEYISKRLYLDHKQDALLSLYFSWFLQRI